MYQIRSCPVVYVILGWQPVSSVYHGWNNLQCDYQFYNLTIHIIKFTILSVYFFAIVMYPDPIDNKMMGARGSSRARDSWIWIFLLVIASITVSMGDKKNLPSFQCYGYTPIFRLLGLGWRGGFFFSYYAPPPINEEMWLGQFVGR